MERRHVQFDEQTNGYDALQAARHSVHLEPERSVEFAPSQAYDEYFRLHKSLVSVDDAPALEMIHQVLADETLPDYLNVSAWSAAELALIDDTRSAVERVALGKSAETLWRRALISQEHINHSPSEYIHEDVASFRLALNLAYVPILQSIVVGNVTSAIRERVFVDVLAIAQTAGVQRDLASKKGSTETIGDMLGFEHECNAHLALLHMDDPRHLPFPSTARGGSGYDHPKETHDLTVLNQHWGNIVKVVPIEVKSKASLNDLKRYEALVVRGKMHLATTGLFTPEHTRNAFAACYESTATRKQQAIVSQVTQTVKQLLQLYQRGDRQAVPSDGRTRYHDTGPLGQERPEFSLDRTHKY